MASKDMRSSDGDAVWKHKCATQSWATGAGHAAASVTVPNKSGVIRQMVAVISSVTANPTVDIAIKDEDGNTLKTFGTLADGTTHVKFGFDSSADFVPILVNESFTVSIDPSADAGGADQTLTVAVTLWGT